MIKRLSPNFTFSELLTSRLAASYKINLRRDLTPVISANLLFLGRHILQPLRDRLGAPIVVTSGFRNFRLNSLVNGSPNSYHLKGAAADVHCHDMQHLFELVHQADLPIDECIFNPRKGYLHLAHNPSKRWPQICDEYKTYLLETNRLFEK